MQSVLLLLIHVTILSVVGISVTTALITPKRTLRNVVVAKFVIASTDGRNSSSRIRASSSVEIDATTFTSSQSPMEFVDNLLHQLSSPETTNKGQILLDASSDKWRQAIYQAIGASPTTTTATTDMNAISKSLQDKMLRSDSQFAILMGGTTNDDDASITTTPFTIAFPSDIVDYRNDGTVWLECQLRQADTNKLFVIMGMSLLSEAATSSWKILSLDWQDFREPFYPGLSGREWLRAF